MFQVEPGKGGPFFSGSQGKQDWQNPRKGDLYKGRGREEAGFSPTRVTFGAPLPGPSGRGDGPVDDPKKRMPLLPCAGFLAVLLLAGCDSSRPGLPAGGKGKVTPPAESEVSRPRPLEGKPLPGGKNPTGPGESSRGEGEKKDDPARLVERLKENPSGDEAYEALKKIGPPAIPWILREVRRFSFRNGRGRPSWQSRAVVLLSEMGRAAVPSLAASLADRDEKVRLVSVLALASMGKAAAGALTSLQAAARDPDEKVRLAARGALLHLLPPGKTPLGPPVEGRDRKGREVHRRK